MTAPILAQATGVQHDPSGVVVTALFYFFGIVTVGSALGVVLSRNIVRMAVWLLFTLTGVAGLYFLLAAEFLAAVQLVVYAGGTLILIIFGVMLTSKSPFSRFEPKTGEVVIAVTAGVILLFTLVLAITNTTFAGDAVDAQTLYPVARLGQVLLGDYLIPFEVVSVLLLVVMIGAAYLAKGRRRESDPAAGRAPSPPPSRGLAQQARQWS